MTKSSNLICCECVGDDFLRAQLDTARKVDECDYCGERGPTISLKELAEELDRILKEHFHLTSDQPTSLEYAVSREDWSRDGWPLDGVIADIVGVSREAAADLQEVLSNEFSNTDPSDGEPDPYGSDAMYEALGPDGSRYQEMWVSFCKSILTNSRYFSRYAEACLSEMFNRLDTLRGHEEKPAISVIGLDANSKSLFRARVAHTEDDIRICLLNPSEELGPPPSEKARAGRMNPAGISVFYGAMDLTTCISEIRPPVGSFVIAAQFEVIRPLHLLDFNVLESVFEPGSYFDPDFIDRQNHAAFLSALGRQISKPVLPNDETFGYLPTQAVAEYLSEKITPPLDGIIYRSTQTGSAGHNIILFHHASKVDSVRQENIEVEIDMDEFEDEELDGSITIVERQKAPKSQAKETEDGAVKPGVYLIPGLLPPQWDDLKQEDLDSRNPALRLQQDTIEVLAIPAVDYSRAPRTVIRIRMPFEDDSSAKMDF